MIHPRRRGGSALRSTGQRAGHLLEGVYRQFLDTHEDYAARGAGIADGHVLVVTTQQISDVLLVDLDERHFQIHRDVVRERRDV